MALTPEDVVNKRFQTTKFREGYDQDEVDDFLDEVVIEMRRLGQENEEFRQRLVAADARIAELQRAAASAQSAPVIAPVAAPVAQPAPAVVPQHPVVSDSGAPSLGLDDPNGTNNLLQLARRLHEEHVREGVAKRDALISDGQNQAAELVAAAERESNAKTAEIAQQIGKLNQERAGLERKVEELRAFEREYRSSLRNFIEGQLRDLDGGKPAAEKPRGYEAGHTTGQEPAEYPAPSEAEARSDRIDASRESVQQSQQAQSDPAVPESEQHVERADQAPPVTPFWQAQQPTGGWVPQNSPFQGQADR